MMKSRWSKALLVALLCVVAPAAFADTVSMSLLGTNLVSWGGQYVSPYDARITAIDGVPQNIDLQVICLDVSYSTYVNISYVYDRTFDGGPSNFGAIQPSTTEMYQAAARLGHQLLYTSGLSTTDRGRLSFAIWQIFNGTAINSLSSANQTAVSALVTQALAETWMPNFQIFTPLNGQGNYNYPSQRMMSVSVPEGSAAGMLGICLFGLFGLVLTLRRRAEQQ